MPGKLRSGFTTGAAAAAAAKAALELLLTGRPPTGVTITFLTGETTTIRVHGCREVASGQAWCTVIKDAGDDPDITHGAGIFVDHIRLDLPPHVLVLRPGSLT